MGFGLLKLGVVEVTGAAPAGDAFQVPINDPIGDVPYSGTYWMRPQTVYPGGNRFKVRLRVTGPNLSSGIPGLVVNTQVVNYPLVAKEQYRADSSGSVSLDLGAPWNEPPQTFIVGGQVNVGGVEVTRLGAYKDNALLLLTVR